jgi:hypothetical protein
LSFLAGAVHKLQDANWGWRECYPVDHKEVSLNLPAMAHWWRCLAGFAGFYCRLLLLGSLSIGCVYAMSLCLVVVFCLSIRKWMAANFLLLNSDKTEILVLRPKKQRDLLLNLTINFNGCTVFSNKTVKDLGVTLDPDLSFDEHIKTVSRSAFFHLRNITKIRNFPSKTDAEKLIHAFVTSRLNYCNALLSGYMDKALNKLQLVLNTAAKILTRTGLLVLFHAVPRRGASLEWVQSLM